MPRWDTAFFSSRSTSASGGGETVISVYAEKNLQSSFGGVPYAIAAAIFLVIGVSAFSGRGDRI